MDITAESIAQAYATAPHGYVRVRHSIIAGEPWSSFVSTVVAVDGDTVAYTSDGIWYSRATRDESLAWELIDTPPACEHWECALIGPACAVGTDRAADLPACHVAGCDATPTHTDPAWSAAGLAPYVCRAHYISGVHVFAAPRVYDALLTAYEYTLLIASGHLTRENALTAALTRDALPTDAERTASRAARPCAYCRSTSHPTGPHPSHVFA